MFGRRGRSRALRVFFATDVHGSDRCFRKFLAAAATYEADALILGGDICGKGLVPIQARNGTLTAEVRGEVVSVPRAEEGRLRDEINRIGFASVVVDDVELDRLAADQGHRHRVFEGEIVAQVRRWCELAAQRLPPHVRCIITPGNDDPLSIDPVLAASERVECPEGAVVELGPVLLASLGDVTPTPWNTEREYPEDELAGRIDAILEPAPPDRPLVLNVHCPPYSSGLDFAPELDADLRPVLRGGRPSVIPVGSTAVREAIKRYQPVVGLHGHIHESRGAQKIGRSLCLNPGSDYTTDLLRGVLVDFDADGSYLDFVFTAG